MKTVFEERIVELCDEVAKEGWSVSASIEIERVRKEICCASPDRLAALVGEYDDLLAGLHCKTIDRIYVEGFKDALSLMKS